MTSIATITQATGTVSCTPGESKKHTFTATNTSGTALRVGARVMPADPAQQSWFTPEGKPERDLNDQATDQFTVRVQVPADAPPGEYTFRLLVFSTRRPGEDFTEGPEVALEVRAKASPAAPPPPIKKGFPWWIPVVIVAVLAVGGGLAWWLVTVQNTSQGPAAPDEQLPMESVLPDLVGMSRQLVNLSSKYCLDTDGRAVNGGVVRMWECATHPNQTWTAEKRSSNQFRFVNSSSHLCLDTDGRRVNGGTVRMWKCADHPNQLWEIHNLAKDRYRLKNKASGFCLDTDGKAVNGGGVRMWKCAAHPNQSWFKAQ